MAVAFQPIGDDVVIKLFGPQEAGVGLREHGGTDRVGGTSGQSGKERVRLGPAGLHDRVERLAEPRGLGGASAAAAKRARTTRLAPGASSNSWWAANLVPRFSG